jgi:HemY protein
MAGRFLRARKAAMAALAQEESLREGGTRLPQADQVRALAHLLAAESAQSLQDKSARDHHLQLALDTRIDGRASTAPAETRDAAQLRAARWALEDHDPQGALDRLAELPQGAARRTLALRVRLKAARQARQSQLALETARLLAKHRAFSAEAAKGIVRSLGHELLGSAHDVTQLERVWASLDAAERAMPELAIRAAQRMAQLGQDSASSRSVARQWLLPIWDTYGKLGDSQRVRLVTALEKTLHATADLGEGGPDTKARDDDAAWLVRIETAQQRAPRDANLQYLCGMGCIQRQLWGKAQQLLSQAAMGLQDATLHRNAWRALAALAEQRGDSSAAQVAYRKAAEV